MFTERIKDIFSFALVGFIILVLGGTLIFVILSEITEGKLDARCAELGWREGKLTVINWKKYCVKRQDQTDVIVPLSEIEK